MPSGGRARYGIFRNGVDYWADFEALNIDDFDRRLDLIGRYAVAQTQSHFFEFARRAAKVPSSNCVMIGNSETKDIILAADMGMRTVRVAIEESVPAVSRADFVCSSLEEVGRVVRRLSTSIA